MKNIKLYLLSGIAMLMLTACPGPDPKPNPVVEPEPEPVVVQTYTQEIVMPPKASEQVVTLNQFSTAISTSTVENSASWLTVEQLPYESGSPQVKLRSTDNTDKAERKSNVTITATSGDKVILSVTQQSEGTGIDDLHGSQTDKPAYSRQK